MDRWRVIVLALLFAFWSIETINLDRHPPLHEDEAWILSPGYKWSRQGVFGSDLFTGFYGMEQHYFEFPPLMSIAQGMSARVFGLNAWSMRYLPVAFGILIMAMTFAIARRLSHSLAALLAVCLLIVWQWRPAGDRMLYSGIPLIDVSRIARYDVLAALLGLCALWCFIQARASQSARYEIACGIFIGLAGLAQLYGSFWLVALSAVLLIDRIGFTRRPIWRTFTRLFIGAFSVWSMWLVVIAMNWQDFVGQVGINQGRFSVLDPAFYLDNLKREVYRWFPLGRAAALATPGGWLLMVGAPAALVWLIVRTARQRDARALWLLMPTLIFSALLAVLVQSKNFDYLISLVPLVTMAAAWLLAGLWQSRRWRAVAALVLLSIGLSGTISLIQMQRHAEQATTPNAFFAELQQIIPPDARVIGVPQYWLALSDRAYRSIVLPFYLSDPALNRAPLSFEAALTAIAPQFVVIDPSLVETFGDRSSPHDQGVSFWAYLNRHDAQVVATLTDNDGSLMQVYRLNP